MEGGGSNDGWHFFLLRPPGVSPPLAQAERYKRAAQLLQGAFKETGLLLNIGNTSFDGL